MSSTVEKLSSNQVRINFVEGAEVLEKGIASAYKKIVKRINIPGFRKGKAPRKVIEIQYGESIFYEEAFEDIFPELYKKAVEEHGIKAVDRPSLNEGMKIMGGEPLEFSIDVYVRPDVVLGEYKGVTAHRHETEVTQDDAQAEIERARERIARFVDITDRPVKLDDQVDIDYQGFCEDEQFDGGTASGHKLVIGSGQFIPGFEEQLIGASVGQELDVNVVFPEQYHAENLAGKPAVFKVKVNAIQEKELPELDDEFAKDVSEYTTLAEYKEETLKKLQKQAEERADNEFENDVIEHVVENATVEIPEAMIEDQLDSMMRDMEMRMMYQGMRMQDYLRYTGQTVDQMRDMYKEEAERRVKTQLVLEEIKKTEGIEATQEEIDAEIAKYAEQNKKSLEEFTKMLTDGDRDYFTAMVGMNKTVEMLKKAAVVEA